MKTRLLVLGFAALCLSAAPAMAELTVQEILDGMTLGPNPGASHITVAMDKLDPDAYWDSSASGGSVATMIIEIAGNSPVNSFGLFDSGSNATLQVFDGPATAGTTSGRATIYFFADGTVVADPLVGTTQTATFLGEHFGFYLNNGSQLLYSDTAKNSDSYDHMWAFQGDGIDEIQIPGAGSGIWGVEEYVLAFEDQVGGGDQDHNDFVVMVESITPVPVPAAVLLGFLGLGAAGLKLRRFA